MYESNLNIKHSNRSHLYWGIDKVTGEIVGIDEVQTRGLNCNCKCAACDGDFIAKMGEKNRHHFAHQSNYECVYANEIALYLYVRNLLEGIPNIELPEVPVRIGNRVEYARAKRMAEIGNVYYQCATQQYPPTLVAELDGVPTRIILAFDKYYTADDWCAVRQEAEEKWDCLAILLPRVSDNNPLNRKIIEANVKMNAEKKDWVYSSLAARWKRRLEEASVIPAQPFPKSWGTVFECPLHCQKREGRYYARLEDCQKCEYHLSISPQVKCLAVKGIHCLKDINRPMEERMASVVKLQKENEMRHDLIAQVREYQRNSQNVSFWNRNDPRQQPQERTEKRSIPHEERIRLGRLDVIHRMENLSAEPVFDRFNVRWIKCIRCQEIKPADEMAAYGGKDGANRGICRDCARGKR